MDPRPIEIQGIMYIPRVVDIPANVSVTVANSLQQNLRVILPNVGKVMVNGLTREVLDASGAPVTRRFKFKWGMTDGGVQFTAAGVGIANDRVVDSLMFGNGQFPRAVIPAPIFEPGSTIAYEVEDISGTVPYTIHFNFVCMFLIRA